MVCAFPINFTVFLDKNMNKSNQYILFLIFCFFIVGCGKSPEDIFSQAEEAFNTGNYRKALRGFTQIVSKKDDQKFYPQRLFL